MVKIAMAESHPSGAKQAAERGLILGETPKEHPSGAKAMALFCGTYGTTEAVPFQSPTFTKGS